MRTSTRALRFALPALALFLAVPAARAADGLSFVGSQQNKVAGLGGMHGIAALAVSPDGTNVYVASTISGTITTFARDVATGALAFVEQQADNANGVDGLDHVQAIALSPDGTSLYAAGELDDAVAVFARDGATGRLTFVEADRNGIGDVTALNGPRTLAVSADGAHVYVATGADKSLVVFRRDAASGALAFVTAYHDGVNGVSGLSSVEQLVLDGDGLRLHAVSSGSNALATFARDPASGALTYVGRYQHSATTFDGLDGAHAIAVTPDGRWLYAAGKLDDAIGVFARDDSATGALAFLGVVRNGVDDVAGLDGVEAVAISPDGTHLYAAAAKSNAVATFAIDPATGALGFLHAQVDGTGTIEGLGGAAALALAPDGTSVYVAGTSADTVVAFSTRCGDGVIDAGEQCEDGNGVDGDGCSAGCRTECQSAADCADADPCTTEVCRGGECAMPQCGLRGTLCELNASIPAMQAMPECLPLDHRFGGTIRTHLRQARTLVQLVRHPPPPPTKKNGQPKKQKHVTPHALNGQVGKVLTAVELKAGKLAARGTITPACLQAVDLATERLRSEVSTSLLGKGLCSP